MPSIEKNMSSKLSIEYLFPPFDFKSLSIDLYQLEVTLCQVWNSVSQPSLSYEYFLERYVLGVVLPEYITLVRKRI